jgi:hypothetical protein
VFKVYRDHIIYPWESSKSGYTKQNEGVCRPSYSRPVGWIQEKKTMHRPDSNSPESNTPVLYINSIDYEKRIIPTHWHNANQALCLTYIEGKAGSFGSTPPI